MQQKNYAQKIGKLINQVRRQRGLTQAEFAKQLGTSQSAVNRIEKGNQNVSIEMLGRISDVLNKRIIKIANGGTSLQIKGGQELSGSIEVKSSKNAAVALLCASLLNKGTTKLNNMPRIEEVFRIIEALNSIGVKTKWTNNDLEIKRPTKLKMESLDATAAKRTRSVLMFIGPLIHELKEFKIPYSGGCKLGERTVKPHLYALENFGVDITAQAKAYKVSVNTIKPESLVMYEMGETATENAIMAAAGNAGPTTIKNASHNYMIRDLCYFLQKLGLKIEGIGTNNLTVHGQNNIRKNVTYTPAEDPIEAMAFLSIAATTNSEITIKRAPIDFLELELLHLHKMGLNCTLSKRYKSHNSVSDLADITVHKHKGLKAPEDKILPLPFPGINMDNLPFFAPIAAIAQGKTLLHDWAYENRAIYFTELSKLGANVTLADPHRVYIEGPAKLSAADVVCPPALRPAVIILIAMMAANGTSILRNIYSIARGYEDLAERLNALGAKITVLQDL